MTAQNLVPNFSFESTTSCQNDFSPPGPGGLAATPWVMPTVGSPDIFNTCAVSIFVDVPVNLVGNQSPITGDKYAGFLLRFGQYEYREYLQAPLIQPLIAGSWYYVSFFVSPGESGCAIEHIGAHFSVGPVSSNLFTHLDLNPQVESDQGFLDDYDNWILISGCFQAVGGETHITLGNFDDDPSTPLNPGCPPLSDAYYYIENISVIEGDEPGEIIFDLGGPFTDCDAYEIDPGIPDVYYLWEDGSTLPSLLVTVSGTYSLTISDGCNFGIDSVEVTIDGALPPLDIGPDEVFLCEGESYTISLDPSLGEYIWQDGSTDTEYTITTAGAYSVTLDDGCSLYTDEMTANVLAPPSPFSLGDDGPLCVGESLLLSLDPDLGTFIWQDGSTNSSYSVTESGTYAVTISNDCGEASAAIVLTELEAPDIELGPNQLSLCTGEVVLLELDPNLGDFLWQDGTTAPFYEITVPGTYAVTVSNLCGSAVDQVAVTYFIPPVFDFGPDTALCAGDTIILSAGNIGGNYVWQDASTSTSYLVTTGRTYLLTVTNACGVGEDSITISSPPSVIPPDLGADFSLCLGETAVLYASSPGSSFLWNDASTADSLLINAAGVYSVSAFNACFSFADSVNVSLNTSPPFVDLPGTLSLCQGEIAILDAAISGVTYLWNDNSLNQQLEVSAPGIYSITVSNTCGTDTDSTIILDGGPLPVVSLGTDVNLCPGEVILLSPVFSNVENWLWQDGSTLPSFTISAAGIVTVDVSNTCGFAFDTLVVGLLSAPPQLNLGPDTSLCPDDTLLLSINTSGVNVLWPDGSTNADFIVSDSGLIVASISNNCGTSFDTLLVLGLPAVNAFTLGQDQSLCPGETIVLSPGIDGVAYLWQDGSIEDSLLVDSAGAYSVMISNACGSLKDTIVITVSNNPPQVNLPDQLTLCQGQTLTLDAAISGVSFLWNDNSSNQQLAVSSPGTYSVTVTNACGVDVDTTIILDGGPAPVVDIGNDLQICAGDVVPLSPAFSNVDAWLWNDGSTLPSFVVSSAGIVIVQVNNTCGVSFDTLLVNLIPASPPLDLGPDTSLCAGEQFILSINTPGVSVLWPDGSSANDFIVDNAGLVFASITNACGSSFDTLEVFPLPDIPSLNLGPDQFLCPGEVISLSPGIPDVSYLWQDGLTNNTYQSTLEETIILTITNSCGSTSDTLEIFESTQGPQVDLGPDIQVCQGEVVTITSNISGVNYLWQDGSSSSDFITSVSGTFILEVSNNCGTDSDTIFVSFLDAPDPFSLGPDTLLCPGETVLLSAPSFSFDIMWQDGSSAPQFLADRPGTYVLLLSNDCGVVSDQLDVSFDTRIPIIDLDPSIPWCDGDVISLDATQPFTATYLWSTGDNASAIEIETPGIYTVEVVTPCSSATQSIDIYASTDCGGITINNSIYLPNVFSPNGDGINDLFLVSYGPDLEVTAMQGTIFDRWGNLVFSSQDIPFSWDGFFAGEILMPGVFVYTITIKYLDEGRERERVFAGDVTLVR